MFPLQLSMVGAFGIVAVFLFPVWPFKWPEIPSKRIDINVLEETNKVIMNVIGKNTYQQTSCHMSEPGTLQCLDFFLKIIIFLFVCLFLCIHTYIHTYIYIYLK